MTARARTHAAAVAIVVAVSGALLVAQTPMVHIYIWNGKSYTKAMTMPSDTGSSMAVICSNGNCSELEFCESCHLRADARRRYANAARHGQEFARRAVRVDAGGVVFGADRLRLDAGRLVLALSSGERLATLPVDAGVLPDRTGRAAFIVYRGDVPPRP